MVALRPRTELFLRDDIANALNAIVATATMASAAPQFTEGFIACARAMALAFDVELATVWPVRRTVDGDIRGLPSVRP
jgi:hypothetical protein